MATIRSTLALDDKMSPALSSVQKALQSTSSAMKDVKSSAGDMGKNMDSASSSVAKAGSGFTTFAVAAGHAIAQVAEKITSQLLSSMDAVFKRIDKMEQFTRVMTVFTGSADIADAALSRVRDTVVGTAFGLDVAAGAVQDFVTSGMSVGIATDQVEALSNAVAFYGAGTNEALDSVTTAWGKMANSVTVSATDINSIADQGINVYALYADAVGSTAASVKADLSAGTIGTQEFQQTLTKALMEGSENFPALAGAAKEAGASWQGTFDNMRASVVRGMLSITESIDAALKDNNLPTMREMIVSFGNTAEMVLGKVSVVVGALVDAFAPVGEALKLALDTSVIGLFIEKLGGMENIGRIFLASLVNGIYQFAATWLDGIYKIITVAEILKATFVVLKSAIPASLAVMKATALTIIEALANSVINVINTLITAANTVPGVSIETISAVSIAAGAQAEAAAATTEAMTAGIAAYGEITSNIAERQAAVDELRLKGIEQYEKLIAGPESKAATAGAGDDWATDNNLIESAAGGKALKTTVKDDVSINGEDLKMLLDISTRKYQMTYQTLTPEISVNVGTINENANVNQVIDVLAEWTQEAASASLFAPA